MDARKLLLNISLSLLLLTPFIACAADRTIAQEYCTLAQSCVQEGKTDKAIDYYKEALRFDEANYECMFNLANILYEQDNLTDATHYYEQALGQSPDSPSLLYNLGICYNRSNKKPQALQAFERAAELDPIHHFKGYIQAGLIVEKDNDHARAFELFDKALHQNPENFDALYRAGNALKAQDKFDQAVPYFRRAHSLQPKNTSVILELANTLNMMDCAQESLDLYQKALEINPHLHQALYNFGYTLKKLGHIKEAIEVYDQLIADRPDYAQPRFSRSLSYLMLGDFERGWPEYEWRWQAYNETPKRFDKPLWDGSNPAGKRILLYAEQGLGDTFQFIRYAKIIKEQGGTVIVETQRAVTNIIRECDYIDTVFSRGEPTPDFDYQIPLMSLPLVFNTTVDTVPTDIPYLSANERLTKQWKNKLAHDDNFKIGICWQGNANYRSQFLRLAVAAKSMQLEDFKPLSAVGGVSFYSLQKVNGTDQLSTLDDTFVVRTFPDFDESNGRFMDSAALIRNLDLVITVDTSVAHLAGALGIPVWTLLPHPPDWRWMLDRTDTPWYPNMRLFRQPTPGDWDTVMQNVVNELRTVLGARSVPQQPTPTAQEIAQRPEARQTSDVAELIDRITLLELRVQSTPHEQARTALVTSKNKLEREYHMHVKRHPQLNELKEQLRDVNYELWKLDNKLNQETQSVFSETFTSIAHKAHAITSLKNHIKGRIKKITVQ